MSLRGYWRTFNVLMACNPAIRITRLTTSARTGRRMKRSVKFFTAQRSTITRLGRDLGIRCEFVIDHDIHSIAQFEDARAHDLFSALQSFGDRYEVAAGFARANELLAQK